MFEDGSKTARHRFEWWEDIRYRVDSRLSGGIRRHPTQLVLGSSGLVKGAIRGFQISVLAGSGSDAISNDSVACVGGEPVRAVA